MTAFYLNLATEVYGVTEFLISLVAPKADASVAGLDARYGNVLPFRLVSWEGDSVELVFTGSDGLID